MINGTNLLERGWPEGPLIGTVLKVVRAFEAAGIDEAEIIDVLDDVLQHPAKYTDAEHAAHPVAEALLQLRKQKAAEAARPPVRDEPMDAPIWGEELIDPQAIQQLQDAMRLPVTVAGALMPDAHVGYGIPIGGVVALDNAVAPYMVGVDIACRMMMSLYPTDRVGMFDNEPKRDALRRMMREETRFGIGAKFGPYDRREHNVLDDPDWNATRQLKHLKDKAHAQLGTSGTGNHFVDAGILEVSEAGAAALGVPAGTYLAFMTHSGSRGMGATIANHFSKLAKQQSHLPKGLDRLAYLSLDSEAGQEYWVSMNLAGKYASACHHTIHKALSKRLGEKPLAQVENHHNFAWKETWNDREVVVHRKGATPAHEGVLGIIPGSQGHASYIVRGKGNAASIHSASHGAGRLMSRTQAINTIPKAERNRWLAERGVELLAGGMDEAPQAYKNIEEVLALQADLVEPIATFHPRLVLMAADGKSEG